MSGVAKRILLVCLLITMACAFGCAKLANRKAKNYETVKATPNRNTAFAKSLNTEAIEFIQAGDLAAAEEKLNEALVADVSYGPAHNTLGYLYHRSGRYYLAAWEYQHAIKTMGHLARPHNNLGMVYESVDRLEEAIAAYSTAYELGPEDPLVIGNLARALMKRDEKDPMLAQLLEELLMHDTRSDWRSWAREKLATGKLPRPESWETVPADSSNECHVPTRVDDRIEELPPRLNEMPMSQPAVDIQASFELPVDQRSPKRLPNTQ